MELKPTANALIASWKLPVNETLSPLPEVQSWRSALAVAERVLVLTAVQKAINGDDRQPIEKSLKTLKLWDKATAYEQFVITEGEEPAVEAELSWQTEALWTLLWALGHVQLSAQPTRLADLRECRRLLVEESSSRLKGDLLKQPHLRSAAEMMSTYDLNYRLFHSVELALEKKIALPRHFHADMVAERYHALRWLAGHTEWDE